MKLNFDEAQEFKDLQKAGKKGLFGKFNTRLNDALQSGRGPERGRDAAGGFEAPHAAVDDVAIRRPRTLGAGKMIIPEGGIVEGNLTAGSETEVSGRVDGDITVDGRLILGPTALVAGSVRAGSCRVEGQVEGRVECSEELDLGKTGRLNADVVAGKRIHLAGQVFGNVTTPGILKMAATCKVTGDVRARSFAMEEGAYLTGRCTMRTPAERNAAQPKS